MELKAINILNIFDSLTKLADLELSLDTSYIIAKNLKEISIAKDVIENKRNKLVVEYAEKYQDGSVKQAEDGSVKITDINGFSSKLKNLLDSKMEVPLFTIPKKELSKIEISPKYLIPLIDTILEE